MGDKSSKSLKIKSMTGYGSADQRIKGGSVSVEMRALNSKQLDLSVRLQTHFRALEQEVRALVSGVLNRGKVEIFVKVEHDGGEKSVEIDEKLFQTYFTQFQKISKQNGIAVESEAVQAQMFKAVLRMPDVVITPTEEISEEESKALLDCVEVALSKLDEFRANEGNVLGRDIVVRVESIKNGIQKLELHEDVRIEVVKQRIRENIEKLDLAVDENRLEQEMVFYVERFDVTEEKVRLSNHCDYFIDVASSEEFPGRKLNFISQEMGREINTLGSKANNADIQKIVVEMKDELEKIKEQLLNVL